MKRKPEPLYQVNEPHGLMGISLLGTFSAHDRSSALPADLIKHGVATVGVAKFLGCEKTLVKNPSEAVGPYNL